MNENSSVLNLTFDEEDKDYIKMALCIAVAHEHSRIDVCKKHIAECGKELEDILFAPECNERNGQDILKRATFWKKALRRHEDRAFEYARIRSYFEG